MSVDFNILNEIIANEEKHQQQLSTTAAWTIVHGDAKIMLLGNVEIDKLLATMKEQLSFVQAKTKEIFEKELISQSGEN